jgi:two-component system, NtrC family, nitrogen regulation response regulator NtrX
MRPLVLMPGGKGKRPSSEKSNGKAFPRGKPRSRPARILLASGNARERAAWRAMLSDPEYKVTEVENGAAALKVILLREADLVIAAITMPKLDALELLRAARDIRRTPPIVVVALGHSEINHVYLKTAKLFGAAAVYMQPFDAADFVNGIQVVLKRGSSGRTPASLP